jgi:hypothetical protein
MVKGWSMADHLLNVKVHSRRIEGIDPGCVGEAEAGMVERVDRPEAPLSGVLPWFRG